MKIRTLIGGLVAGLLLVGTLTSGVSAAGAATTTTSNRPPMDVWPAHYQCGRGTLDQYMPDMTSLTGRLENVWFRSWIQKWDGQNFQYLKNSAGRYVTTQWFQGTANQYRTQIIANIAGAQVTFLDGQYYPDGYDHTRLALGAGYYRTVGEYFWSANSQRKYFIQTTGGPAIGSVESTRTPDGNGWCQVS